MAVKAIIMRQIQLARWRPPMVVASCPLPILRALIFLLLYNFFRGGIFGRDMAGHGGILGDAGDTGRYGEIRNTGRLLRYAPARNLEGLTAPPRQARV